MKRKITSAVLALAGAVLLTQQAQAQNTYTTGDLLLGFSEAGATNDYLVDIGAASTYIDAAPGSSFVVSDGNIALDLSSNSLFGSGWATNSNVLWGIAGGTDNISGTFGLLAKTVFLSKAEGTPGVPNASPLIEKSSGTEGPWDNVVNGTLGVGFNGSTQTANSTVATIQLASNGNSWATTSANAFGSGYNIDSNLTPTGSVLDLYELQPHSGTTTPGTFLGDFSLSSGGVLTFQAAGTAAIPEPSSWALGVVGFMVMLTLLRRKKVSSIGL